MYDMRVLVLAGELRIELSSSRAHMVVRGTERGQFSPSSKLTSGK